MNTKIKYISLKAILITIAVGIWVLVLQNAGVIPTKQNVYVKGGFVGVSGDVGVTGDVNVNNTVSVQGSVDVDNTVSVSIDEVLGRDRRKYYFNNN